MTPQEIIENNILLARFCDLITENAGGKIKDDPNFLKFHNNWNWLMGVVDKIESLEGCDVLLFPVGCSISYNQGAGKVFTCSYERDTKIEATYKACAQFVKWYGQNKVGN